jgi:hypothetical protein
MLMQTKVDKVVGHVKFWGNMHFQREKLIKMCAFDLQSIFGLVGKYFNRKYYKN